ncbi:MAG: GNAT family N-acetyltransferase [Promicromonosporaceae bacterium]|nr:GNAT family N-acetyltransferase [Promicromonosporaceae bacterium]
MRDGYSLRVGALAGDDAASVQRLAKAAEAADGVTPLSEQRVLRLGVTEPWLTHVATRDAGGEIVGYAQIGRGAPTADAEIVVHPAHRRRGIGRRLLQTAERDVALPTTGGAASQELRIWAHGDIPAAQAFAATAGYDVVRELLHLGRSLGEGSESLCANTYPVILRERSESQNLDPAETVNSGSGDSLPLAQDDEGETTLAQDDGRKSAHAFTENAGYEVAHELLHLGREVGGDVVSTRLLALPAQPAENSPNGGFSIRAFQPGVDDEAWVVVNARAFAGHTEQGRFTLDDLHRRMAEPWFDPAGLFIAEADDATFAGYVWTKIIEDSGEIYVLGIDPAHQGHGLGRRLLTAGLAHIASRVGRADLYVDGDNAAARRLYATVGFTETLGRNVQYAKADATIGG